MLNALSKALRESDKNIDMAEGKEIQVIKKAADGGFGLIAQPWHAVGAKKYQNKLI